MFYFCLHKFFKCRGPKLKDSGWAEPEGQCSSQVLLSLLLFSVSHTSYHKLLLVVLVLTEYVCVCIFNSASVTRKEKHMFLVSVKHLSSWNVYHWIVQFLVFLLKFWPLYPCWSFFGLLSKTFALIQPQPRITMHISLPNAWLNSAFSLFCLKSTGGHQNCYISNINHVSSCRT